MAMKYALKYDDALIRITLIYEEGNYKFERLDFQDPMGWIGCDPLGKIIRRDARHGYISLIYIRIPHGGNAVCGINDDAMRKRTKAILAAKRKLLRDEIKRLRAQDQRARKLISFLNEKGEGEEK